MEAVTITTIPTVTRAVPSALVASVATIAPAATTLPIASTTTSAIAHPSDEAGKLIKVMQDMAI